MASSFVFETIEYQRDNFFMVTTLYTSRANFVFVVNSFGYLSRIVGNGIQTLARFEVNIIHFFKLSVL